MAVQELPVQLIVSSFHPAKKNTRIQNEKLKKTVTKCMWGKERLKKNQIEKIKRLRRDYESEKEKKNLKQIK